MMAYWRTGSARPASTSGPLTMSSVGDRRRSGVAPGSAVSGAGSPSLAAVAARRRASPPTMRTASLCPELMRVSASEISVCWGTPTSATMVRASAPMRAAISLAGSEYDHVPRGTATESTAARIDVEPASAAAALTASTMRSSASRPISEEEAGWSATPTPTSTGRRGSSATRQHGAMDLAPTPSTAPMERRALVVAASVSATVWLLFSETWPLRPLRWLVTLVHEAGHATVARMLGNDVLSVTINPSGGGLTFWQGGMGTISRVLVGSAGYVGAAALGGALLAGCRHLRSGRVAVASMAGVIAAIAVFWVPWRTNPSAIEWAATGSASGDGRFTWLACIVAAAGFAALAAQRSRWLRRQVVVVVATT